MLFAVVSEPLLVLVLVLVRLAMLLLCSHPH